MSVFPGRRFTCLSLLLMPMVGAAGANPGLKTLVELEYHREVLMYCGISDPDAVRGFLLRQKNLVSQFDLDAEDRQEAMSRARRMAHEEWQNRGLGGFRGWCRNEGVTYTETLKSYTQMQTGETE